MGEYGPVRERIGFRPDDYIICVDAGVGHAAGLGVTPALIVGDLDSVGALPPGIQVLKFHKEKDETDTILAIQYGLRAGMTDFVIAGGLSGRLDHTLANLSALLYLDRHGGRGVIIDEQNEAFLLPGGKITVPRRDGFYLSVFPFGADARGVRERKTKYTLTDATLCLDFPLGVSNEFSGPFAEISVEKGPLLIILSKDAPNEESAI